LAIAIGALPPLVVFMVKVAPGPEDFNYIGYRWVVRSIVWLWIACVAGLIWSVRDEKRRQRVWTNARVPHHPSVRRNDQIEL
jgi:hypothetical protein